MYETLKFRNRILYFIKQHIERLFLSAKLLELEHPFTKELVEEWIEELIEKNSAESCNIKILLIGGKTSHEATLYILLLNPLYPNRKLYTQGAKVETIYYERFLPNAKSLNMLMSYLAFTKAQKNGCYDALLLDKDKNILEGTRTNFFAIKDKTLVTAPKDVVLEGVTRQVVIKVAQENGYSIKEELIPLDSLSHYDGAFLTSTSSNIMPLIQIDDYKFNQISENLKEFMQQYDAFLVSSKGVIE